MSEEQSTGGVRRFGRKDRKKSLDPRGPLFPIEDDIAPDAAADITPAPESELPEPVLAELVEPPPVPVPPKAVQPKRVANPSRPAPTSGGKHILANLLTIVFLLATIGMGALVAIIARDPYTPLNPFPPFTPLPIVITATFLPPTATAEGTAAPTATFTPIAIEAAPSAEAGAFAFALVPSQPIYAPNANTEGCNWSSIAGTVTDSSGTALDGYRVHISGNGLDETVFSGAALTFGAGGFELFINGTAQEQTFTVQLLDPQSQPLSPEYSVTTRAGCDENVAILSFVGS
ncbi:MAG: hypothetical protein LCI00_32490 [Chloroflexi bacterium]|nr:hypothetical protein [Chloroflexota bacterium]MCC6894659.1 hypothetical protein [Anaerolineae bacterium]